MVSDLEVLILIPAASHLAANHFSEIICLFLVAASRTTSSATSRDVILRSPKWKPWKPQKIQTIKAMNKVSDTGQPWPSPTLTRNESDLLLAVPSMRTKLWHRWYSGIGVQEDPLGETVKRLLHVPNAHGLTPMHPDERVELVHCSMARKKKNYTAPPECEIRFPDGAAGFWSRRLFFLISEGFS